jgi:hypothetical protein
MSTSDLAARSARPSGSSPTRPSGAGPTRRGSAQSKTFTGPRLRAAIADRLTFGANIVETGTDSYRLAQTRA